jgi:hypothetical protein
MEKKDVETDYLYGFLVRVRGDSFGLSKGYWLAFFCGPVKTAHKYFPIDPLRFTLAEMRRGEHVVMQCNEEKLWAIGWHDHHYKCYVTTHGTTLPGKPADKKRQNVDTMSILPFPCLVHKL